MDERRSLDYYITYIFWGSGIFENARAQGIIELMRATIRRGGEATVLNDIESDAVMPKRRMRVLRGRQSRCVALV
jgi:hypothetical protein